MVIITDTFFKTQKVGKNLAKKIKINDIVGLEGPLGAGKTTLIRGLLRGLGVKKTIRSPSFVLVREYNLKRFTIYHYDLYRIKDKREFINLGWPSKPFIVLIEWADKVENFVQFSIKIKLNYLEERKRKIEIEFLR